MWRHHVISWHPVPLELVSGVQMNTIHSLRRLNCVTGGCLCIKTAYCVFDESTGWYFLEYANSHHISLYLGVKMCLLPFYHPRVCIVKYCTLSFLTVRGRFFLSGKYSRYYNLFFLYCNFLFYVCWYMNYIPVPCYCLLLFSVSILCISDNLYILIFLLFSLTGIFPYPRHN
jgi:hypothetical protein